VAVYANPGFVGSGERLKDLVREQAKSTLGLQPPSVFALQVLEPQPAASLPFDVESYLLSLFLGMSLCLTGVMVPSMLLAEEKEKHTIRPLLVAPVSVTDLAVGKTLAGLFYVLVSSFVIVAVNGGLSSNLVALGLTVLVSCLFVVQVGLLLGSVFNDVSSLNTWSSVVILPLLLPAMLMPLGAAGDFSLGPLFSIMRVIPTYYATDALGLALSGVSLLRVAPDLMILLICTILCFLAAERLLRRIQRT
jgi:ABC-2 type transport system permease protein